MEKVELKRTIEALLFASSDPVTLGRFKKITGVTGKDIKEAIHCLQNDYMVKDHAFQINEVASGYLLLTMPEYDTWVSKLAGEKRRMRLTQAALETLAIVAYKQPIIRAEVEEIRGVKSDGIISQLIEKNLITIAGRADTLGRPHYLRTTKQFLDYFGLKSLDDLPSIEEIERIIKSRAMENQISLFPITENSIEDSTPVISNEAN